MTNSELRQKIEQQLDGLSRDRLLLASNFLDFLQVKQTTDESSLRRLASIQRGGKGSDLLEFSGTWQGDNLEECLRFVRETRSKAQF